MAGKLALSPGLYLAGFMGSGKTSVARVLAGEMGWTFVDLDERIEAEAGAAIPAIFETRGEAEFRRLEHEAVKRETALARRGHARVVALGGGAFTRGDNRELLLDSGVVVWLDVPLEEIRRRIASEVHRPLARDAVTFERLFEDRQQAYARADFRVDGTGSAEEVARRILDLPLW